MVVYLLGYILKVQGERSRLNAERSLSEAKRIKFRQKGKRKQWGTKRDALNFVQLKSVGTFGVVNIA